MKKYLLLIIIFLLIITAIYADNSASQVVTFSYIKLPCISITPNLENKIINNNELSTNFNLNADFTPKITINTNKNVKVNLITSLKKNELNLSKIPVNIKPEDKNFEIKYKSLTDKDKDCMVFVTLTNN